MNITRHIKWLTFSLLIMVVALAAACAVPQSTTTRTPVAVPPSKPVSSSSTISSSAPEAKVTGTVTYLERIALPAGAGLGIKLLDISKQDAPAVTIGEQVITTSGEQVPFSFSIKYNPASIDPRFTYAVQANITVDGQLWFTTDTRYAVITQGNPSTVAIVLKRVAPSTPVSGLENTNWVLQSYGQPGNLKSVLPDASITALFDSKNGQLGGSSGVNRYSGGYELKNGKLLLATPLASTMMAGPQPLMDQEQEYLTAIQAVESYQVKDGILQLNCGKQILVFTKELSKGLSVDITSSGQEVSLAAGETLTVTLESNATTGYSWNENASIGDKTVLQQTDHKYQPPAAAIPGAGGKEVWHFQALKTGTSKISMEYRRPFEPNAAPAKTFTLAVIVN